MAITRELFRTLIREGQEEIGSVELYDRPFDFEEAGRYVMVGIRQAGKSYMLYKRAKQLLSAGHSLEEMVYINFDDERLIGITANELDLILQAYQSVHSHTPIFFFDEIQNVEGWEHFARRLANRKSRVYITGSNAKMLGRDIQTTLGGRYLEADIFPYSFREYLEAQGVVLDKEWEYGSTRGAVQKAFAGYLRWGGFPELLLFRDKRRWLNDLYEKIMLGDIAVRNKIKNDMALRLTLKRLAENVMQPVSFRRLAELVKAAGVGVSVATVGEYVRHAQNACLVFPVENYASKFAERESVKKHYFTDNGLLSVFQHAGGDGALLENLCAIHLHRLYGDRLFFYGRNVEVDFYVPDEGYAVQVAYCVGGGNQSATYEREVKALRRLHSFAPLRRMTIVTSDEEGSIGLADGGRIEVVAAWRWLLTERGSGPAAGG